MRLISARVVSGSAHRKPVRFAGKEKAMINRLAVKSKVTFLILWIVVNVLGWLFAPINALAPDLGVANNEG